MEDLELKQEFISEAADHLANIEDIVLDLEKRGDAQNREEINHLFRSMHSIKGSSSFLELVNITELSHSLENVIDLIRKGTVRPDSNVAEALLAGIDKLKNLIKNIDTQDSIDISAELKTLKQIFVSPRIEAAAAEPETGSKSVKQKVQQVNDEKTVKEIQNIKEIKEAKEKILQKTEEYISGANGKGKYSDTGYSPLFYYKITIDMEKECDGKNRSPYELFQSIAVIGRIEESLFETAGDLSDNSGQPLTYALTVSSIIDDLEILIKSLNLSPLASQSVKAPQPRESRVEKSRPESSPGKKIDYSPGGAAAAVPEEIKKTAAVEKHPAENKQVSENKSSVPQHSGAEAPAEKISAAGESAHSISSDTSVKISLVFLEKLMNLAGELVLVRNQNIQAVELKDMEQIKSIAKKLNIVTSDLQSCIMKTRMQKIEIVFARYTRLVRDLARKMNKLITFEIIGREVELDRNIIEAIGDPLTHLLRNSVDHGIEPPDDRAAAGKPRAGKIVLGAYHQAGHVVIRIEDDGRGIDPGRIRKTAVAKGMMSQHQADLLSDLDAFKLIFEPGFSTAENVSDISGRGVGMDVVKTNFQNLGGVIEINSKINHGTVIEIRLPLTLTILNALIVNVQSHCFAIPQLNISEVVWLYGDDVREKIIKVNDQEVFSLRGNLIPMLRLASLLGIQKNSDDSPADSSINIIILKLGSLKYGLIVDTIFDTEEIVVKSLHRQLKNCKAYSGTTVLGDGRIAIILDIVSLGELARFNMGMIKDSTQPEKISIEDQQSVIAFHIGGREHFAISLFLIQHIEKIDRSRIMIANKREYIHYQENIVPVIHIEDAIEDIESSYGDEMFLIILKGARPIGILTAEIIDTTMIKGTFDTETVVRPGIIGADIILGHLTMVLDVFTLIEKIEPDWFRKTGDLTVKNKRILLLEDTNFYSILIKSILSSAGIDVEIARNGNEGLEALSKGGWDFIISDLEMPGMDGYNFARAVRGMEKYRDIPLLAISAMYNNAEGERLALEAGFDSFISKRNKEALMDALKKLSEGA